MRILFISNFYPPGRSGGYTQWCYEVAESLEARGHNVVVLTSRTERASPDNPAILRLLHLDGDLYCYQPVRFFATWRRCQRQNRAGLEKAVEEFRPHLIFVWGMWAMSKSVASWAEGLLPGRTVYYISDYWPMAEDMHTAYWRRPAQHPLTRLPKKVLAGLAFRMLAAERQDPPRFEHAICVSEAVRDILIGAGLAFEKARVIHGGTDLARFQRIAATAPVKKEDEPLQLLYAGQLVAHKGVHTAVEAVSNLVHVRDVKQVHLTLVGRGYPDYESSLHKLTKQEHLENYVTFSGPASREEMPAILKRFDVLVFPSVYEEPLARTTQEAMAAGLTVVGTTTGGTKEILVDGENGLTFSPGSAEGLARQIERLVRDPALRRRLAEAGKQTIADHFNLSRMVFEIDAYLQDVLLESRQAFLAGTLGEDVSS